MEVYRAVSSAQIQPNDAKLMQQHLQVLMDNDPKCPAKASQELLKAKASRQVAKSAQ